MNGLLLIAAVVVVAVAFVSWRARGLPTRRLERPPGWGSSTTAPVWGRRVGVVVGLVLAVVAGTIGPFGIGEVVAAPLFGLAVLLGVLGGELAVAGPHGRMRNADLTVRRSWHYLPVRRTGAVVAASGVLLGLLTITARTGTADESGRPGRALTSHCPAQHLTSTAGPWPGTFYAIPLGVLVLVGLGAAAFTLHHVSRRPRLEDRTGPRDDEHTRRRSAEVIVAAVGIMVTTSLAGVCAVCAVTISDLTCHPAHASSSVWGLTLILLASLALLFSSVRTLAAPSRTPVDQSTAFPR